MESKEKNTKEKILEEALKLFAQSGYMGTSMNDIASKLGVTKAALYKHYKSKQEILDSIIEKMKELDIERAKQYEMPEGDLEKVKIQPSIKKWHLIRLSSSQRCSSFIGQRKSFQAVFVRC